MDKLGYRIFFDRYALKDTEDKDFHEGDFVAESKNPGQREIGTIIEIGNKIKIRTESGREISADPSRVEKILESNEEQMFNRIAAGIAAQEKYENREIWTRRFKWLLSDFRFVPGGRVLAGAGTSQNLTYFNYYVLPSPGDSRISIVQRLSDIAEVISRGGGVGLNISSIRPKSSYVKGVDAKTSGAVSWAGLYSFATGLLEQGSTRRGTLLLILDDWHPDIEEFVSGRRDIPRLSNANISVNLSDEFMEAVKQDLEWTTVFPDTAHPSYNTEWNGDIAEWRNKGYTVKEHGRFRARKLWSMIVDSIWNCSEPGIFFGGTYNRMSNNQYCARIRGTNPYGEQGLPEWGSCNLGSINLPAFLEADEEGNLRIDKKTLGKAVRYAVRFLDDVIEDTPYFFEENRKRQKNERPIGIGTMGLAELLAKLHIPYGSDKSIRLIDEMYKYIAIEAYTASAELAAEKGPFGRFSASGFLSGGFAATLPKKLRDMIAAHGIRNCTLLTQAPSGMTGTMIGTSSGIEPYPSIEWKRGSGSDSETGMFPGYAGWKKDNEGQPVPDWVVTKDNLSPEDHLRILVTIQKWIDTSISKSFEIPASFTKEQVSAFIIRMYDSGCKNARLIKNKSEVQEPEEKPADTAEAPSGDSSPKDTTDEVIRLKSILQEREQRIRTLQETNLSLAKLVNSNIAREAGEDPFKTRARSKIMKGITEKRETPVGTAYITVNKDENDDMFEVFATIGKVGSDVAADAEGICRLISLVLRMPSPYTADERAWAVIHQLRGIGSGNAMGTGRDRVMSLSDGIAKTMASVLESSPSKPKDDSDEQTNDICPECGNATMINAEGCRKCMTCGYTK